MNISTKYAYPISTEGRDLRLDFLRGLIMLVVISVHMEYFSFFSMLAWERIGLVSSAEGFVALSGIVLGIVYKKRMFREGFKSSALKLWTRSFQLYRVNIFVILSIALLGKLPFIDVYEVTHWSSATDKARSFLLYPVDTAPWIEVIGQALLLRIGPHQFQVIGLYVGLIAIAPCVLYCLQWKKTGEVLVASWLLFLINQKLQLRITGGSFEMVFPTLTWQLLFVNGMVIGYHHEKVLGLITERKNKAYIIIAACFSFAFFILALNNPNAVFWPWKDFSFLEAKNYHLMYVTWFQKPGLGIGRIINNVVLFIVFYHALSHYWLPINKTLGWLFIPLGQASLYVFIIHVYFVLLVSNTPLRSYDSFLLNTLIHAGTILIIWAMVKRKVLFQIIPR